MDFPNVPPDRKEYVRELVTACLRSRFPVRQPVDGLTLPERAYAEHIGQNFLVKILVENGRATLYVLNRKGH